MSCEVEKSVLKKKNRVRKSQRLVAFEEEIVSKDVAQKIIETERKTSGFSFAFDGEGNKNEEEAINSDAVTPKKRKRKKKEKNIEENEASSTLAKENHHEPEPKKKKRQKTEETIGENEVETDADNKNTESIRARKRKRHAELLKEKKLKAELEFQQKALNYLSKWKHSRNEWKFEKLRQVWLQQNMYDEDKIPQEFWATLLEYFSNSKGKAREVILKEAVAIIEKNGENEEENIKVLRARDIIQNLQE